MGYVSSKRYPWKLIGREENPINQYNPQCNVRRVFEAHLVSYTRKGPYFQLASVLRDSEDLLHWHRCCTQLHNASVQNVGKRFSRAEWGVLDIHDMSKSENNVQTVILFFWKPSKRRVLPKSLYEQVKVFDLNAHPKKCPSCFHTTKFSAMEWC